jgi:hypothetical protein
MKKLLFTFTFFLFLSFSFAQTFSRLTNESADSFIKRIFRVEELAHPVIETKEWDSSRKVIFAFIAINSQSQDLYDENKESIVIGYCFLKMNANDYQRVLIDTFHENGGEPRIETVFFVNADKDKEREIAIMVRTPQIHRGAGVDGDFYDTYFYDNTDLLKPAGKLNLFEKLSAKFSGFDGDQEGKHVNFQFKDVATIRRALKGMGY